MLTWAIASFGVCENGGLISISKPGHCPFGILYCDTLAITATCEHGVIRGCVQIHLVKYRAEANLSDPQTNSAEYAFVAVLGFVGASGMTLFSFGQNAWMPAFLVIHLGAVAAFLWLTPYTKWPMGFIV